MKLTIEVTEEDIKRGEPSKPWCCAIALAYRRTTGHKCEVTRFDLFDLEVGDLYNLPQEAANFICDFDMDSKVEPFSFDIETP